MITAGAEIDEDDADVYVMMPEMTTTADVVVSVQDPSVSGTSSHFPKQHVICHSVHNYCKGNRTQEKEAYKGVFYQTVSQCMQRILRTQKPAIMSRMKSAECVRTTPSLESGRTSLEQTESCQKPEAPSLNPNSGPVFSKAESLITAPPEVAMFATSQTIGILDLGASQTVMGQHQVPEFLDSLPEAVRELVQERPVTMSFRFGNNSIVPCHKALFVPVDKFWIKIAIVESRTPFLISNSVCRSLGAVIDTNRQSIFFKVLNCELPLELSSKKLFLLDFCALTDSCPPKIHPSLHAGKHPLITAETVLASQIADQTASQTDTQAHLMSGSETTFRSMVNGAFDRDLGESNPELFHDGKANIPGPEAILEGKTLRMPEASGSNSSPGHPCSDSDPISVAESHDDSRSRVSFRHSPCHEDSGGPRSSPSANVPRGAESSACSVWRGQEG